MKNVAYAKTVSGKTIVHHRPDQDYSDTDAMEAAFIAAAVGIETTVTSYAIADHDLVSIECPTGEDLNLSLQVGQKSEVPENAKMIAPGGMILADIPNDGYVVYIV